VARRSRTGLTRVASCRLPSELLTEPRVDIGELQFPIGLTVTAAITGLLGEPSELIHDVVDRVQKMDAGGTTS
jgi:hypothetical protein